MGQFNLFITKICDIKGLTEITCTLHIYAPLHYTRHTYTLWRSPVNSQQYSTSRHLLALVCCAKKAGGNTAPLVVCLKKAVALFDSSWTQSWALCYALAWFDSEQTPLHNFTNRLARKN